MLQYALAGYLNFDVEAWGDDSFVNGQFVPAVRQECSDVVLGAYIAPETASYEAFSWVPPSGSGLDADASVAAQLPTVKSTKSKAFTVTACYCRWAERAERG